MSVFVPDTGQYRRRLAASATESRGRSGGPAPVGNDPPNLEKALDSLFGSRARADVVRFFVLNPGRAFYQRQVESATGQPIRAVQRELERLTALGLLYRYAEGNRTYCQVDEEYPLFEPLRALVLRAATPLERLRSELNRDPAVRLAFYNERRQRVLVIHDPDRPARLGAPDPIEQVNTSSVVFAEALAEQPDSLAPYLAEGVDVLGRRDDILWRRIEEAGYKVAKGKGVV